MMKRSNHQNPKLVPSQTPRIVLGSLLIIGVAGLAGCDSDDNDDGLDQGLDQGLAVEFDDQDPQPTSIIEELPIQATSNDTPVIYGGGPCTSCGWPTTVSLGGSCTGTLIHPEIVAYAAHCGANYSSIRFGNDLSGDSDGFNVGTEYCRTYPGYTSTGNGVDFAYCRLVSPVKEFPIVPPLMGCETELLQPGAPVAVVGFGNADNGPYGVKREVYTQLNGITNNNEASVGGAGKDSCQGDSGGPVFIEAGDGSWRVFGITSYGGACGGGGYYSMMHIGMPWFESDSGLDLTPCHDAQGNWEPGPDCAGFPIDPAAGGGAWPSCEAGDLAGVSTSCGAAYAGDEAEAEAEAEAEPEPQSDPQQPGPAAHTCEGACGGEAPAGCWCDDQCSKYGDCCEDVRSACG